MWWILLCVLFFFVTSPTTTTSASTTSTSNPTEHVAPQTDTGDTGRFLIPSSGGVIETPSALVISMVSFLVLRSQGPPQSHPVRVPTVTW